MSDPGPDETLDEQAVASLARAQGLQHVYETYRADLIQALALVGRCRRALGEPLPRDVEPWPPMRPYGE